MLYTVEDNTFAGPGKVALWTKADSGTHFDTIAITPLDRTRGAQIPYEVKPLACDPTAINGMSERIVTGGLAAGLYTAPNTPGGQGTANRHRQHEHPGSKRRNESARFIDCSSLAASAQKPRLQLAHVFVAL